MKGLWGAVPLALVVVGAALTSVSTTRAEPGEALRSLQVTVTGVRNAKGSVSIGLYTKAEGWPVVGREAVGRFVEARKGTVSHRFTGLRRGRYAVAVYHDENGNKTLDMNFVGAPREGVGFSRGARARFRAPDFDDAVFELGDRDIQISLEIDY